MTVTKIEEINKSRVRVFLDGEFAFVLYKGELRLYGINEEKELAELQYRKIITELLPKRAKLRSMNLLKARAYTEKQLRDKLKQGEYAEDIITEALEAMKSYGYIDDRKYAEDFIVYHMERKSQKRMEQDLYQRGIDKKIVKEIMKKALCGREEGAEENMARELLKKKNYSPNTATAKEKQRLTAFLYRKGFQMETIRNVLSLDITSI